jgi:dipeptidyl aminopeptidase/acylaminoacyl peptidase
MANRLTMDAALGFKILSDAQITPDGSRIAFVVADSSVIDGQPRSQIWAVVVDNEPQPFSSGDGSDFAPRWSPNGREMIFLSDRGSPGVPTVYLWREGLGEARALSMNVARRGGGSDQHRVEAGGSLGVPLWSSDGERVSVLIEESEAGAGAVAPDPVVEPNPRRFARVWEADVRTGQARPVTGDYQVWEFDRSTEGDLLLLMTEDSDELSWYRDARLAILRPGTEEPQVIYAPARRDDETAAHARLSLPPQLALPRWSPDSRLISCITCTWSDRGIVGGDLVVIDVASGAVRNLTEGRPISISWVEWRPDHSILAAGWAEGEQALLRFDPADGAPVVIWQGEAAFSDRYQPRFTVARDETVAVIKEDPRHPRELFRVTGLAVGHPVWHQVSRIQPSTDNLELADFQTVRWRSADDREIQGHLMLPPGSAPGTRHPLIVFPHGGPSFLHQFLFHAWPEGPYVIPFELFPASGFALLLPNPRGSLGWGRAFAEANIGDFGGADMTDIFAGIDYLIQNGIADADRLGIAGWSSAGYQAAWATCISDRFRAAAAGAGAYDWRSLSVAVERWPFTMFFEDDAFKPGGRFDEVSPLSHVDEVTTPTLIIHNERDHLLPLGQAYAYYRALRDRHVPVELVVYPREGHSVRERGHQLDIATRIIDWFRRWLPEPADAAAAVSAPGSKRTRLGHDGRGIG